MALTARERGFLLLGSHLGDPERKCLSAAQFRELARRVQAAELSIERRQMEAADLRRLGYSRSMSAQILALLEQEELLDAYLNQAQRLGIGVLTRVSRDYPGALRARLGRDAPVCLWYQGELSCLNEPGISLVGNRTLRPANEAFARQAGHQAAEQGFVLISGNARGADRTGQTACVRGGGQIIRVLPDELTGHSPGDGSLLLSEDSFDAPFSPARALSRNRIIHCLSPAVLVAQCDERRGGTWDGTWHNLRHGWSRVCCLREDTAGIQALSQMGAMLIDTKALDELSRLCKPQEDLFSIAQAGNNHVFTENQE